MQINDRKIIRPFRLAAGDTIGIVAPSSPFDRSAFDSGIEAIHQMGFHTKIDSAVFDRDGYLAGPDAQRAARVNAMFADSAVQAVMCARGGYGALRILDQLDYSSMATHPKPFIGFSDITAIHQAMYAMCRLVTFHGPTVTTLWKSDDATRRSWYRALTETGAAAVGGTGTVFLHPGAAEGILVGGNLNVLSHLIGTAYWVPLEDKLLFIEDTGEAPYRIDRMLVQMRVAGLLEGIVGVVLGTFERCGDEAQIRRIVQEVFDGAGIPIFAGAPIGHGDANLTIPLGAPARLDSDAGELAFTAPVLEE